VPRSNSPHDNHQRGTSDHDHDHGYDHDHDHGGANDYFVADYDRYDYNGYAVGGRVWSPGAQCAGAGHQTGVDWHQ
jgi:hypothetical protein